ncbi:hypothetical protein RvY_11711 [Ramazzottius varieornatus]|uniref:DDE-1 domain-containing protein n=1 Tax=Ramazzottius varieornatus TaxID=947166 RepID=A0A1D1VQU4_RAMVA|nr:hypothetical protein RvY_11711 [Ramazzottius varieornatus]
MIRMVIIGKKTLSPKGVKQVPVKHPQGDKEGMTINLTIKADGTKFPAEIIFKTAAKSGKLADSYLKKLNAPSNLVIFSAKKAWWNQEIEKDYHNMHLPAPVEKDQMTVLFRDQFSVQKMDENVDSLEWRNVQQILIPLG